MSNPASFSNLKSNLKLMDPEYCFGKSVFLVAPCQTELQSFGFDEVSCLAKTYEIPLYTIYPDSKETVVDAVSKISRQLELSISSTKMNPLILRSLEYLDSVGL